jgi:uncharacterized protein YcfJ
MSTGLYRVFGLGAVASLVTACAQIPTGPSVAVMPSQGKPFEVFVQEDQTCRAWAAQSMGAGQQAESDRLVASSVTGAVIGALAGAMVGGHRNIGAGAAMGTAIGATAGSQHSGHGTWAAQRRYDIAYQQCMYAKGNLVPGYGANQSQRQDVAAPVAPLAPAVPPVPPAPPPPAPAASR